MENSIRKNKRYWVVAITLLILFGAALRLYKLGSPTLDTDEISSVLLARLDIGKIVYRSWNLEFRPAFSPKVEESPLIYLLIRASLKINDSDAMARLPSAILGVACILVIFILARQWLNETTALWSSFLLTFSLYHIFYSQLARGYAGFILFVMLSFYFLLRYAHHQNRFNLIGLILSNTGGIYFHFAMLYVIIIEAAIFFIFFYLLVPPVQRPKSLLKPFIIVCFAIFSLCLLTLPAIVSLIKERQFSGERIPFEYSPLYIRNLLCRYGAGNGIAFYVYNFFAIAAIIFGLRNKEKRRDILAIVFWLCAPFLLIVFSGSAFRYAFHNRYFIYIFPAYILLVAYGISSASKAVAKWIPGRKTKVYFSTLVVLIFLIIDVVPLKLYYRMPAKMTDWKGIARYIAKKYSSDKMVYIESPHCVYELGYYLDKFAPGVKLYTIDGEPEFIKKELMRIFSEKKNDIWYVDNSPVFDSLVFRYFNRRIVFGSTTFYELGKRELIDWDKSWFSQANIRRYFPCIYLNSTEEGKGLL